MYKIIIILIILEKSNIKIIIHSYWKLIKNIEIMMIKILMEKKGKIFDFDVI